MIGRRAVLECAVGAAVAAALPLGSRRVLAADAPAVVKVTDKIAVVTGCGGNVVARAGGDGLVLVDAGAAASAGPLLAALRGLPNGARVRTLFNTHWHHDQIGANAALARAGAHIVAHEKTRARLAYGYYLPGEDRYEPPVPKEAQPAESFYTTGAVTIDGEHVEYGYLLEAHTDGDCYVFFRDSNVIAVGGAASPTADPELDWFGGGWIGGRVDSLQRLLALGDARTRFVPSDGPPVGRAAVQAEHELMTKLFEKMVDLVRKGDSYQDIVALGVLDGLGRTFADPAKLAHDAHKSLWAHYNTLSPDIV